MSTMTVIHFRRVGDLVNVKLTMGPAVLGRLQWKGAILTVELEWPITLTSQASVIHGVSTVRTLYAS